MNLVIFLFLDDVPVSLAEDEDNDLLESSSDHEDIVENGTISKSKDKSMNYIISESDKSSSTVVEDSDNLEFDGPPVNKKPASSKPKIEFAKLVSEDELDDLDQNILNAEDNIADDGEINYAKPVYSGHVASSV